MEYYFSHSGIALDQKLIEQINTAQKTLDIAIYSLTRNAIVDAIVTVQKRGVQVRVLCDRQQANSNYELKDIQTLQSAHIPIKVNMHTGLMHLKICIIDATTVTLGSYNFTQAATLDNDEILSIIHDPVIAAGFLTHFESMWNDSIHYKTL